MSVLTLGDLTENEVCRVIGYSGSGAYRRQLLAFGMTPGTLVTLLRCSPLGDPMEFELLNFSLCLRRHEARCVLIERYIKHHG